MVKARAKGDYGYPARKGIIIPIVEKDKDEKVWPKDGPNTFVIVKDRLYMVEERLCNGPNPMFERIEEKETIGGKGKSNKTDKV